MIHLITYNLRIKLRNFSMVFWPLVFPLILGTFFFFAFGNISEADFETVSVAVVKPETSNPLFLGFLNQIENNTDDLISVSEMPEQKASGRSEKRQNSRHLLCRYSAFPYSNHKRNS